MVLLGAPIALIDENIVVDVANLFPPLFPDAPSIIPLPVKPLPPAPATAVYDWLDKETETETGGE